MMLTQLKDLELIDEDDSRWSSQSDFPLWEIIDKDLLKAEFLLFSTGRDYLDPIVTPRLFFDCGQGYLEHEAFVLPVSRKGTVRHLLRVPDGVKGIALSPVKKVCHFTFDLSDMSVHPIGKIKAWSHRVNRLWRFRKKGAYGQFINSVKGRAYSPFHCLFGVWHLYECVSHFRAHQRGNEVTYCDWLVANDCITDQERQDRRERIKKMKNKPLFSVIMPVFDLPTEFLYKAIQSVQNQLYPNWELCIADDCSTDPEIKEILKKYQRQDSRIKVVFRELNGHISRASNSALELATGEYIALLDHDDELHEMALYWIAEEINKHPEARFIYSDEDKIDSSNWRYDPHFKPDWNPELFYSINYICHLAVIEKQLVDDIGRFRPGFEGSQDYDLFLRATEKVKAEEIRHIPKVLYHWRAIDGSTASQIAEKDYATKAGLQALNEFVSRTDWPCRVDKGPLPTTYRLVPIFTEEPSVTIIIPTRNGYDILRTCVTSVLEKTNYTNYDILIVDNQSDDFQTLEYLVKLNSEDDRVQVLKYDAPFNYSKINNYAIENAKGELICLLNNDIEVITPDWLREKVFYAQRTEIGAVGAKLLYPDGTLQHGGVILGIGGVAGHAHKYFPGDHPGYFCRAILPQALFAVTGACLLVRKSIYKQVGGMDEDNLQVAFNDVDFCLKMHEAGYRNLWTPYAELYHHESKSRGQDDTPDKKARFKAEGDFMQNKWSDCLLNDPMYSPHLSRTSEDFSLNLSG